MSTQNQYVPRKQLIENWKGLLEAKNAPEISEEKRGVMARVLENQDIDIQTDAVYRDTELQEAFGKYLTEAEIAGDHGYDPTNIAAGQTSGAITNVGAAVMGIVRRSLPKLIAFDIAGVQAMAGPTGQAFSIRAVYGKDPLASGAKEAFHPKFAPDTMYSGQGAARGASNPFPKLTAGLALTQGEIYHYEYTETGTAYFQAAGSVTVDAAATTPELLDVAVIALVAEGKIAEIAEGMATSVAELQEGFNGSKDNAWNEMSFRIDKQTIEAKSRQLKAQYSIELAQDLRAVHGMDADTELTTILAAEIMLEINREIIDWINYSAQIGKSGMTQTPGSKAGVFDFNDPIDVKGARWQGEAFKALLFQIDKESAEIARQTGRGAGNFIIATRNVVNCLASVDTSVSPAAAGLAQGFNADTTKAVFAGVLGGRYRVYIDQYAAYDYLTVGYKGSNELDAGIYYCPYVALTPLRGQDPKNFQPVLGFKTRYGVGINPFANTNLQAPAGNRRISNGMPELANSLGKNGYFRRFFVKGL